MNKDLFGNPIINIKGDAELYLQEKDKMTISSRAERLEYLQKLNPEGMIFGGQMELIFSYRELQDVYIDGHFLSTIVLGQAWIEKLLHIYLQLNDLGNIAKKGFSVMIKYCGENDLVHEYLIKKIEKFRLIRNPITHIKSFDYEHSLDKRSFKNKENPMIQLENDAREIIEISGHIAKYGWK